MAQPAPPSTPHDPDFFYVAEDGSHVLPGGAPMNTNPTLETLINEIEPRPSAQTLLDTLELDMVVLSDCEFASHFQNDGDTLILIDIPMTAWDRARSCAGKPFLPKHRILFSSSVLRSSGFKKLRACLDDTRYQDRLWRRHRSEVHDEKIKYLLRLGPGADEDAQAEQLEALSLPPRIPLWFVTADTHDVSNFLVPSALVDGHDDACTCGSDCPGSDNLRGPKKSCSLDVSRASLPKHRRIPDYCDVRYAMNVIRILRALAFKKITLNSAPRVYTIAGICRLWELDDYSLNGIQQAISSWFLERVNSNIIQLLPAECFIIAFNSKLQMVARATFRVLVAERALNLASEYEVDKTTTRSAFGRTLGDLDEDLDSLVKEGARAFIDRIHEFWRTVNTPDELLPESFCRLGRLETSLAASQTKPHLLEACRKLRRELLKYFESCSAEAGPDQGCTPTPSRNYNGDVMRLTPTSEFRTTETTMEMLSQGQRLMTGVFWDRWSLYIQSSHTSMMLEHAEISQAAEAFNRLVEDDMTDEHSDGDIEPFSPSRYFDEVYAAASFVARCMTDLAVIEPEMPLTWSAHLLLCLSKNETKFLPLWAGGEDDGCGGVISETIPEAEMGPSGPGPAYHTGRTVAGGDADDDDESMGFQLLKLRSATTASASHGFSGIAQDGISTVYRRDDVLTPGDSISERFSDIGSQDLHGDGDASDVAYSFVSSGLHDHAIESMSTGVAMGGQDFSMDSDEDDRLTVTYEDFEFIDDEDEDENLEDAERQPDVDQLRGKVAAK